MPFPRVDIEVMETGARGIAAKAARRAAWAAAAVGVLGASGNVGPREVAIQEITRVAVSGSVDGLVPGQAAPLRLLVTNGSPNAAVVRSVTVAVTAVGPAPCSRYLTVAPFAGAVTVPANGTAEVVLRAALARSLPEHCRSITWRLDYSAQ